MKEYIQYVVVGVLLLAVGYLSWDIWQMKISLSYWNGIANVNKVLDCQHRPPTAYDLVRLQNTNVQTCDELATFIGDNDIYKVAEESQ